MSGDFDFPQEHKADIINVGVSATGKFIMSCSNDTTIIIWTLKGIVLIMVCLNSREMDCFGENQVYISTLIAKTTAF